jgi:O-antigen ligase
MFYLLLPLQFLCITPSLNEGVNLARSIFLITAVTIFVIAFPEVLRVKNKFMYLPLILPGIYVTSALVNRQNPILALLGNYNRNFGILTFIAIGLLVLITANSNLKTKAFLNYGVWPITALAVIYSYMQLFKFDPLVWAESDRTVLTLGNSDYAAAFMGMLIVVPLYGFFAYSNKLIKALMVPLLLLIANAGMNSIAFQFRVLALISVIVFVTVYYWEKLMALPKLLTFSGLFGSFTILIYYILSNQKDLIEYTNFKDRISQQQMGLSMFADHPIFGVGADQMWRFMPMYLKSSDIVINGSDVVPDKTHNVFIDHLAQGGIIAGIIFTAFIAFSLVIVFQLMRKQQSEENRPLVALFAGIWIAYVAQQFISTDEVMLMIMPFMACGLIFKLYFSSDEINPVVKEKSIRGNSKLLIRGVMSALLLVISIVGAQAIYYDSQVKKILSHEIMNGEFALNTIKNFPNPKSTEAIIVDAMSNLQNCPFALVATDELLKVDNRSAQAWYIKTICVDSTGDRKSALDLIDKAVALQPNNLRYLEAKYKLTASIGDQTGATAVLEKMKSINPKLPNLVELQALLEVPATK